MGVAVCTGITDISNVVVQSQQTLTTTQSKSQRNLGIVFFTPEITVKASSFPRHLQHLTDPPIFLAHAKPVRKPGDMCMLLVETCT